MSSLGRKLGAALIGVAAIGFVVSGCGKLALPSSPSPRSGVESIRFFRHESNALGGSYVEKLIKAKKGGKLKLNKMYFLKIPKKALKRDTWISMSEPWPGLVVVDLGPHGLVFRKTEKKVELKISYKRVELGDVNEENLTIYYVDYETNTWIDTNAEVNTKKRTVTAYIDHFSRYALSDHKSHHVSHGG